MNNYGKSAIRSVELIHSGEVSYTEEAWEIATREFFTIKTKACPRSAFLGLCEAGLIKDVYQTHIKQPLKASTNKDHTVEAVKLLSENEAYASFKPLQLWRTLMNGNPKSHNFQMDVVLALWKNDLIVPYKSLVAL
ncbi:hypothetical protein PVOR_07255 [Paenibacillus vortex V453]|uniref:Uncharacterized protein n=1 Tax=Paenibacillus vortex V453 TaxID=715225 RepID=A0A2R9SZ06_9BACL|nr:MULTISPECIES: hypothetical protein [Paenibacillus]ANA81025.1 hypothetical protein A3958_14045 [Paenibacillus glucanolyticus]AVV54856.1 hypothetical protein C7121_01170 [Paenibacillus glucanolyticus]EFU42634.1 hypothetical protein PVOR_07255 [Paenibacillus vortex V453]ETT36411.1 hypothetical protein C169_14304 [Paenibacillus sp. FSL R5-808]MDH6674144.1 hypothetical protein [Paenibacillus sp. LBL]